MNLKILRREKKGGFIPLDSKYLGGFTLVEVIIATAILAFLMGILYHVFWRSSSAWEKGDVRTRMYQSIRISLDVMSREIRCALISSGDSHLIFKGDKDALSYISASNKISKKGEFDLCEIGYSLSSHCELLRRIKACLDPSFGQGGATAVLADNVLGLSFLYYDENTWQERWDSTRGTPHNTTDDALPQAVKITIVTQDEQCLEAPLSLSTIVTLPTS